jgi:hypothetical protein
MKQDQGDLVMQELWAIKDNLSSYGKDIHDVIKHANDIAQQLGFTNIQTNTSSSTTNATTAKIHQDLI